MKRATSGILSIFLLFVSLSFAMAADGEGILGLWYTEEKDCKVEIFKCGDKYCGRIVWLKDPLYPADDDMGMAGRPVVDRENPNPALRSRPVMGLQLMEGFAYMGENTWQNGTIYDPERGKTYKCKLILSAPNRLDVRGFVGIPLFGRTSHWTR